MRDTLTPALRERRQLYADDLPARSLDAALDRFLASIASVREFGKLGAVVFPFPSYFTPGARARDYLEWLRGRSGDLPIAIELRHRDWVAGKQRDATMAVPRPTTSSPTCASTCPSGFDSSQPPLSVATTDTAFVRFHGRNSDAWERGADIGDDRFSYDYKDVDLRTVEGAAREARGRGEVGARDLLRPHARGRQPQRAAPRAGAERRDHRRAADRRRGPTPPGTSARPLTGACGALRSGRAAR